MLKKVLTALAIFILVFVVVGALLSRQYRVSRSIVVKADPAKVHALVADLKRWDEWAPWKESDPTIVTKLGDATTGVGANQSWTGDSGGGWLKFTKCDPASGIAYDMAFNDGGKDMPAKSWMTYSPVAGGTQVEWGMEGSMDVPVVGGYFAKMSDWMMGGMFQSGLDKLKARAEGS
ncbi:MAG: SRPBCC family protein [Planctomycetota bacterium]|nr:SRPBCC family protein [Planctomycetota bacterium]